MTTTQTQTSSTSESLAEIHATCRALPWPVKGITIFAAFMIFPPLGLAALIYLVWASQGRRGRTHRGRRIGLRSERCANRHGRSRTGNSAFDAHRADQFRKMKEDRLAFAEFADEQRLAEDRKAFDAFVSTRTAGDDPSTPTPEGNT